ncbi:MFS transporter [Rhodococcus opacus]|uniref:MFS transporter n=1 Tax=Rhodococcus opacus TaxID=37919 RepID=UPI001C447AE1|nr:MFS transporter [Rhodococcus opacus]MBV6756202.1 MFS transporter [Rhodococcus opacus]
MNQPTTGLSTRDGGTGEVGSPRGRKSAVAGFLGTFVEYYDFSVYGFLVVFTAPLFFPSANPTTSVLASLGAFAGGYVMRPLGALFFGSLGDRRGRRIALLVTIVGMGVSTMIMGLLPTYASIGVLAPILLIVARLLQGFCAGGEIVGAATLVAESSPDRKRGLLQSFVTLGSGWGVAAAPAVVGLVSAIVGTQAMGTWGWRIPLLVSVVFTLLCLAYRLRLDDSPEFENIAATTEVDKTPVRTAIRAHWRSILAVAVLVLAITCTTAVLLSYMNIYMIKIAEIPPTTVYWLSAIVIALGSFGYLFGGMAVDRIGAKASLLIGYGGCAVLIYPAMLTMTSNASLIVIGALYCAAVLFNSFSTPSVYLTFTQAFPTEVRYTGAAIGFNLGAVIGGGFTPYAAAWLTDVTGRPQSPALLVVAAAVVGVAMMLYLHRLTGTTRHTSRKELSQ